MESLALIAALMFLVTALLGPATWLLSKSRFIPTFVIWIMGIFSIIIGLYWFFLPVGFMRFFGLLSAYMGYISIINSNARKNKPSRL